MIHKQTCMQLLIHTLGEERKGKEGGERTRESGRGKGRGKGRERERYRLY